MHTSIDEICQFEPNTCFIDDHTHKQLYNTDEDFPDDTYFIQ